MALHVAHDCVMLELVSVHVHNGWHVFLVIRSKGKVWPLFVNHHIHFILSLGFTVLQLVASISDCCTCAHFGLIVECSLVPLALYNFVQAPPLIRISVNHVVDEVTQLGREVLSSISLLFCVPQLPVTFVMVVKIVYKLLTNITIYTTPERMMVRSRFEQCNTESVHVYLVSDGGILKRALGSIVA